MEGEEKTRNKKHTNRECEWHASAKKLKLRERRKKEEKAREREKMMVAK